MDLAAGSAGFLIAAMEIMIADTENAYGRKNNKSGEKD